MKNFFLLVLFLLLVVTSYAQEIKIPTTESFNKNYYTAITYLTEGDSKTIKTKNGNEIEIAFRVIITTSEIYQNLIVEKITYGSEGGNKVIVSKKKIDLPSVWEAFGLNGETTGLEFIKWVTWDSFELKILDKKYLVKNIGEVAVKIFQR